MCVHKRTEGPNGNANDEKVIDDDVLTYDFTGLWPTTAFMNASAVLP